MTKNISSKHIDRFIWLGAWFGYPKCCVASFLERAVGQPRTKARKLTGTGYVPCIVCDKTKTASQMIETINEHRPCPQPFTRVE